MGCGFCESALANSVGTLVVDYVVKPVGRQLDYVRRFHDNVEKLLEKKVQLIRARTRLQHEIEVAESQLLYIEDDVRDLQPKAVKILSNVETLEMKIQQNKRCLNWCPNCSWRYRLSKKAMEKTRDISELLEKINKFCQPGRVGYRAPTTLPTIEFLCSKEFVVSEASKNAFHQIIEALQDDNISMIGLWGMGGVGKTTLAREVGNHAEKLNLFDKVVITTVSQKPNFEAIQDEIAKFIDFDMKNERGRRSVQDLWLRLKNEQRILIILDDIWTNINLKEKIGIPTGEDHKGCKVLLTTRRQQVCLAMDCQKVVQLGCLDGNEAWNLFAKKASLNGCVDDAIREVATKIIRKCGGLPVAIVPLGSALKGKSCHEWEVAYRRLENRRLPEIEDVDEENAYLCLEASFDYLKGMETKTCFLVCSFYPEDHEIRSEDLVRYAWGLELYKGINSIEEVRSEVLASIEILKNSCLLLDCRKQGDVKMHDVVREVALWIASSREEFSFASVGALPMDESFKHFRAISFNTDQMGELPKGLVFPNLKFLLLGGRGGGRMETSSEFFEGMKALKACALDNQLISPVAFQFQMNLKTLKLHKCRFSDISMVGKLKTLEIFSLSESGIGELPKEIGDLESLRLLELSSCRELRRIPHRLIQRLSNLEELYLHGCHKIKWATENTTEKESYSILSELNLLPKLGVLSLELLSQHLPDGILFPKLRRFDVCFAWRSYEPYPISRSLKISDKSIDSCKQLFEDVESLDLKEVQGYPNLIPSLELEFSKLTSLDLDSCDGMKCLIDASNQQVPTTAFSNLRKLELLYMHDLEELCNGPQPQGFLQNLETLTLSRCDEMIGAIPISQNLEELRVDYCNKMQVLFQTVELRSIEQWPNHHLSLQSLKDVRISDCNSLKYVFPMSAASNSLGQLQSLGIQRCSQLEEIIQGTEVSNINLQSLRKVEVGGCKKLTSLSSLSHGHRLEELKVDDCPRLTPFLISATIQKLKLRRMTSEQLSNLDICNCEELKRIIQKHQASSHDHRLQPICFHNFTQIDISNCENLKCLFPIIVAHGGFPKLLSASNLQTLKISDCSQLEEIIQGSEVSDISLQSLREVVVQNCNNLRYLFPMSIAKSPGRLQTLKILDCFQLEEIIQGSEVSDISLQSLREVVVQSCNNLRYLFPMSIAKSLGRLQTLTILGCSQLEEIIQGSGVSDISLQSLKEVVFHNCNNLRYLFPMSIAKSLWRLQTLKISNCSQLEEIIQGSEVSDISLQSLREVVVQNCNNLRYLFPMSIAKSLGRLQTLTISDCFQLEEIIQGSEVSDISLQSLRDVEVRSCNNLRYLFPMSIAKSLGRLQILTILGCSQLEEIIQGSGVSDISLQSLKEVVFQTCNNLRYLFPMSIAKSLGRLQTLTILGCSQLEEIIQGSGVSDISLQSLKEVVFHNCKNLRYLFPMSIAKSLWRLQTLKISNCSQLEEIIQGSEVSDISLQSLREVVVQNCNNLRYLFPMSIAKSPGRLQTLKILDCFQLEEIIQGSEVSDISLQSLREVVVQSCNNLRYLFPMSIAKSLGRLQTLTIWDCSQLEEIIQGSEVSDISLQSLRDVEVLNCNNLRYLFPMSIAKSLGRLQTLTILDCSQLEEIIQGSGVSDISLQSLKEVCVKRASKLEQVSEGDEANVSKDEEEVIHLPQLIILHLSELPNLMRFSPVGYHFVFPSLKDLKVRGCSNMTTRFSVDLMESVHAETQASQSGDETIVEESATAQETTWPAGSDIWWPLELR